MKESQDSRRLEDLLARWDEARAAGHVVAVEELVAEAPQFAAELRHAIARLEAMDWLEEDNANRATALHLVDAERSPVPALLAGRYRVESLIAEGGFARVFRGTDATLQRRVAIKITTRECLAEARNIAQLQHHGIVSVHDVGHQDGFCFIVFDLIEGEDLRQRLQNGPLPWRQAARIVAEVAEYLQFAHEKCFVHRDIKPANILLDPRDRPVLADFGIAITRCELEHESMTSAGTLAYMSPEQVLPARRLDWRTDIYSLGVVLYELITGELPFRADTLWQLRNQILADAPPSLACRSPLPLNEIITRCLRKNPAERYPSARALAVALSAAIEEGTT